MCSHCCEFNIFELVIGKKKQVADIFLSAIRSEAGSDIDGVVQEGAMNW